MNFLRSNLTYLRFKNASFFMLEISKNYWIFTPTFCYQNTCFGNITNSCINKTKSCVWAARVHYLHVQIFRWITWLHKLFLCSAVWRQLRSDSPSHGKCLALSPQAHFKDLLPWTHLNPASIKTMIKTRN